MRTTSVHQCFIAPTWCLWQRYYGVRSDCFDVWSRIPNIYAHETSGEIYQNKCPLTILHQLYIIYPIQFQPTLCNGRDYLYILRFTLSRLEKRATGGFLWWNDTYYTLILLVWDVVLVFECMLKVWHMILLFMSYILCCRLIPHK